MTTAPNATPKNLWSLLFQGLHHAKQAISTPTNQTYDLTGYEWGLDFIFEPAGDGRQGYITAQQRGVKSGDILILSKDGVVNQYRVEQIDYYSSPPDLWTAYLSLID